MAIFPEKHEKQIPRTLSDCTKLDPTVAELHTWAERIESWGQLLVALLIIGGIILTIIEAFMLIDINEDMIFSTIITSALSWGLYAFIAYCTYHILSLLLTALASITQHTIISAKVALFESQKTTSSAECEPESDAKKYSVPQPSIGRWVCPECGTVIPNDVIRCKCGYKRV